MPRWLEGNGWEIAQVSANLVPFHLLHESFYTQFRIQNVQHQELVSPQRKKKKKHDRLLYCTTQAKVLFKLTGT